MGEVRIKSGNLFDVNGNYSAYMHQGSPTCRVDNGQIIVKVVPYYFAHIKFSAFIPSGRYTVKCKASAKFRAMRLLLTKPFETGTWSDSYQRYCADMVKNDNYYTYTFTVDEDFAIGFAISGTTGDTGVIDEIMLNLGSTALPYQPYFLNRPAHQFVNGEWIDIPTHKYTNGRWQGELTSQSPLKFRADGEMLDWRVEGKTSGNLVESFKNTEYTEQYRICLLSKLDIKPSTSYTISFIMEEGVKAYFNEYIFSFINFTGTGQRQVLNITTKANIDKNISTWVDEYGWILCKNMVNNENPCNFREVMILEGTYTASTLPPYEPYGGVGDWDETEQKYRIPVTVEGENLWDGTFINTSGWGVSFSLDDEGYMVASSSNNDPREWKYSASQIKMTLGAGTYALVLQGIPPTQSWSGAMIYTSGGSELANNQNLVNKPLIIMPFTLAKETSIGIMVKVVNGKYRVQLLEGSYTSDTLPPYEVNLYTDHQLMDGDSIDFATDQTAIPIATGNNTLTVDTAVQPSKVFVKFEG